jgi:hypothetical protein
VGPDDEADNTTEEIEETGDDVVAGDAEVETEAGPAAEQSDEELTEASGTEAGDEDTREQKGGSE